MTRQPLHAPPKGGLDDEWLDVRRVAERWFQGKERAVRGHIARQTLPFKRLGTRILFSRHELEQVFASLPGVSVSEAQHNVALRRGME